MTLYMPPIARKKTVSQKFSPDTRRIFGRLEEPGHAQETYHSVTGFRDQSRSKAEQIKEDSHDKPQNVSFLLQNCRTLNEPICNVSTKEKTNLNNESVWWPKSSPQETTVAKPKYNKHTTSREDYLEHSQPSPRITRHSSNPQRYASEGVVPVTHLPSKRGPRLLVEHISYQHQYNSRKSPSLPIRGKLVGSFVWDVLHPESGPEVNLPPEEQHLHLG